MTNTLEGHTLYKDALRSLRGKVVHVALDVEASGPEDVRKLLAKVTVGEENNAQAARS